MRIKAILGILKEIKYLKSVLNRYSSSLEKGKYYLFNSFRAMSVDRSPSKETAFRYFDRKTPNKRLEGIARKLNRIGFFHNKNRNSTEEYEAFYTANNHDKYREVKLFSFKSKKILTICTDSKEVEKQKARYDCYKTAFNMPRVSVNEKYPNSFEIAMIELMPYVGETEALTEIARCVTDHNKSVENLHKVSVKKMLEYSYDNVQMTELLEKICVKIDKTLYETEIPFCVQHGDLSKDNLIYGKSEDKVGFWWIDWEHAEDRVFFYDYFFYIINSAFYGDMGAYDAYINGENDDILHSWFGHFGIEFQINRKFDYFLIFAVAFLKERVCDKGYFGALKKYFELIERLQESNRS